MFKKSKQGNRKKNMSLEERVIALEKQLVTTEASLKRVRMKVFPRGVRKSITNMVKTQRRQRRVWDVEIAVLKHLESQPFEQFTGKEIRFWVNMNRADVHEAVRNLWTRRYLTRGRRKGDGYLAYSISKAGKTYMVNQLKQRCTVIGSQKVNDLPDLTGVEDGEPETYGCTTLRDE